MTTFISYSRVNESFALRLAKDLKEAGHDVWFDQLDIPKGARWDDEIEKALRSCNKFLIILSPDSIKSQNVKDEIGYAIDSGKHILPVMIKQCEVPFRIRRFQHVDFTKDDYDERFGEINALLSNTNQLQTANDAEKNITQTQKPSSSSKKTLSPPVMIGGGIGIVAIIIAVILMSTKGPATPSAPVETDLPIVATNTLPAKPTNTAVPNEPTSTPGPTSTPEPQPFYTEEFNGDLSDWDVFVTDGDINKLNVSVYNGKMTFDLNDSNSGLFAYAVFNKFEYSDAKIEVVANNRGINYNNVSIICRYTAGGWYEFNIGNDGLYTIFAYNPVNDSYNTLFEGGSAAIKSGTSTNKYTASCIGNKLTLWINDVEARSITVNNYNFEKGKIGLSVSSFGQLPVKVEFESMTISEQ